MINSKEIDLLIIKIRQKYRDYADQYGERWFNTDPFEERLRLALRKNMDMEAFILAEIAFLEKLKEKNEKLNKTGKFAEKVESLIEENNARIKKYPDIEFDERAGMEMRHCFGALNDFAVHMFPVVRLFPVDYIVKRMFTKFEEQFEFLAVPSRGKFPKRIEDHILLLSRKGVSSIDIEKAEADYLKSCGFLLNEIVDFFDGFVQNLYVDGTDRSEPLDFEKLYISPDNAQYLNDNFMNMTVYEASVRIREKVEQMISDFRLGAFKKK